MKTYKIKMFGDVKNGFEVSFRKAIWPILAVSQIFGVMPLTGISCRSIVDLKFKWKSKRTVYGLFVMTMVLGNASLRLWQTFVRKTKFRMIVYDLFYYVIAFGFFSLFVLAKKWPELMECWEVCESSVTNAHNLKLKKSRMLKLRITAFIILFLALVEHSLCLASVIDLAGVNQNGVIRKLAEAYSPLLTGTNDHIPAWIILPFLLIAEYATFVWNFMDLVVIMISMGLTSLFELLNHEIRFTDVEKQTPEFWCNIRSNYRKLCKLVFLIDGSVSHIILVSFSHDMLLICVQLFELLRFTRMSVIDFAYFLYSLVYINIRTFGMVFLAARIHDESKEPIKLMCNRPEYASTESNAFFDEVRGSTVALSGMEFFFLTRKLILSVIGTICTYELVLIQYSRND